MIKYFKTGLLSKTLQYLSALSPTQKHSNLETLDKMWLYLAEKFPSVISLHELDDLKFELVDYRQLDDDDDLDKITPDEWFGRVALMVTAGEKRFPVLSKLALALCTIYNSLSETERDFSLQNLIHTDSKRNAMSQEKLQSHLCIKSHASHLSKHCMRCQDSMGKKSKEEKQGRHQTQHCHCSFMIPDEELLAKLRASLPYQDWNKKTEACKSKNSFEAEELKKRRKEDEKKADEDLKREVRKLKRKAQEIQVLKVEIFDL